MNFEMDDELIMMRDVIRRLAQEQLSPQAHAWMTQAKLDEPALDALGQLGLWGLTSPEDQGGLDARFALVALAAEELAAADAGCAWVVASHNLAALALREADQRHDSLLEALASGQALGGLAMSPETPLVPLSQRAGWWVAYDVHGARWLLDARLQETDALSSPPLGLRSAQWARLSDTRACCVKLGPPGALERAAHMLLLAACGVGVARAAAAAALTYAHEREQFSKRLIDMQVTQFKVADMATRVDGAGLMVRRAAYELDALRAGEHDDPGHARARALMHARRALERACQATLGVSDEAVQLHGGYGYTSEYDVERHYRDARTLAALASPCLDANLSLDHGAQP